MNKQKLLESLHYRVRLWPTPWRVTPYGQWLSPLDYEWRVAEVDPRGIVQVSNTSTHHVAILGPDRIHHFEFEPDRNWNGSTHGLFVLHTQLVLSGRNVFYLPRPGRYVRRRTTH
jgi:hypothetical protein